MRWLGSPRQRLKEDKVRSFTLDEVVAARDAARGFSGLLERLRSGQSNRFVVFYRNRPQAVLLHVDEYEELTSRAGLGRSDARHAAPSYSASDLQSIH